MLSFVIVRDRVTYAQQCVEALERAGLDVLVVDHESMWPEARQWLEPFRWTSPPRIWSDDNRHPRDLWRPGGPIDHCVPPGEQFIVTDCDVVPDEACPGIWVDLLHGLLDANPAAVKAGLGLRTDDLPPSFAHAALVRDWEAKFQPPIAAPVNGGLPAVWADIDTTLSLYRRYEPFKLGPAIRTTAPYLARHLPWYEDTANPTPEQAFYYSRAEHGHWRAPDGFNDEHGLGGTH